MDEAISFKATGLGAGDHVPALAVWGNGHTLETRGTTADDFPGPQPNPQHAEYQNGKCDCADHPQPIRIEGTGGEVKITSQ